MKEKVMTMAELPPPNSTDIERQILNETIFNADAIMPDLIGIITPDMFSDDDRREIWNVLVNMFNKGEEIDLISVKQKTKFDVLFREAIGPNIETGGAYSSLQHAALLRDVACRRRMYYASLKMLEASTNPSLSEEEVCSISEGAVKEVQGEPLTNKEINIETSINRVADELEEQQRQVSAGKAVKTPSGIQSIERLTYGGFGPGQLVILAARPSVGKTALMLQMSKAAASAGVPSTIFSLEMTSSELTKRLMYSTGFVGPEQLSAVRGVDWSMFESAANRLTPLDVLINDKSRNLTEICSRISVLHQRGRCGIAFIDYLSLMRVNNKLDRKMELGLATRELKLLAMQCGIPIVVLAQLNRDSAKDGRPPMLYDLKDSGDIEQDADIVMMLENASEQIGDNPPDINLWLRKNRGGRRDICIALRPNTTYSDFRELGSSE